MPKLFDFPAESMPSWYDGNYSMWWSEDVLQEIKDDGASQVVIVPTVYMDTLNSTVVYRDNNDPGGIVKGTARYPDGTLIKDEHARTESDGSIKVAIAEAKERGLEVVFKLHVNMQNDDWNALIGPPEKNPNGAPLTEAQKRAWADKWFASYKEAVVHYAKLAQEQGVTAFAIGNECESMTNPRYTKDWEGIIEAVRQVYKGKLTYAATWTEALHIEFWGKLDYIGANPYIAFTQNNKNPTVQQLVDGWTLPNQASSTTSAIGDAISAIDALKKVAQKAGKKLIFTETGFRSMDGNNSAPWEWGDANAIDEVEQLNMHKAFYKIITDRINEDWIGGYWLWNYEASEGVLDTSPDRG